VLFSSEEVSVGIDLIQLGTPGHKIDFFTRTDEPESEREDLSKIFGACGVLSGRMKKREKKSCE
jgi:hypothetical protein